VAMFELLGWRAMVYCSFYYPVSMNYDTTQGHKAPITCIPVPHAWLKASDPRDSVMVVEL